MRSARASPPQRGVADYERSARESPQLSRDGLRQPAAQEEGAREQAEGVRRVEREAGANNERSPMEGDCLAEQLLARILNDLRGGREPTLRQQTRQSRVVEGAPLR
jgi:hypothetical protein